MTTIMIGAISSAEHARMQGFNDLLMGLASAVGSLESGFIFAALGYSVMAYGSAVFAMVPFVVAWI